MLVNTDIYLCSAFHSKIQPISEQFKLSLVPRNLQRTSKTTFMFCDSIQQKSTYGNNSLFKTRILERDILTQETRIIEEFEGLYTSWSFCNDYALLLNGQGDILLYNMLNKNVYQAEKQHPGLHLDAEIMHTDQHFVTCGGSVKNQINGNPQRIIKIWNIDNADCLTQASRINTGHRRAIENSLLMNKTHVVSVSSDKSIRFTNILTGQLESIVKTDFQMYSICQIDYNSVLSGGVGKNILAYDKRLNKRVSSINIKIPKDLIHICHMKRFTDNCVLISNIFELYALDLRNWKLQLLAEHQGERVSQILALNEKDFVVGNREKTVQVWKAS